MESSIALLDFNPHTREGCDRVGTGATGDELISIHTPVKGVTQIL